MATYLLSIVQPDGPTPPAEVLETILDGLHDLNRQLKAANAWVFAGGLHPPAVSSVVTATNDEDDELITDGPFVETKEHLGGFTIIDAADLDAALAWATKLARVTGLPIEVRPFADPP